ncbi:AMP-binding protein [Tumebacillus permanentifrigoris]|uniref:Fatty-acyl-CoA synthase n=1 Tax=Tumebacillus permanentifrigoris TaxID=378543 RepID=A0A316D5T5_9BACL|nr:AMP-binding protein [Tumebacillus permanentifrigoris]PWK08423.1 fatty-acyl-CoA synthase [Tumebacillus permanentifrigoris]
MAELMNTTIGNLLDGITAQYPDNEALVYHDRGLRYSYREFHSVVSQAAKGLMKLGLQRGEHIAIWATNYPEWVVAQFATAKIGSVLVTVNTSYRAHELEYLLRQSESTTLILMEEFKGASYLEMLYDIAPELRECAPGQLQSARLPFLKNVIFLGAEKHPGLFNWSDIMELGRDVADDDLLARQATTEPDDVINMQYTSGTTGFPKGVMLTHNNLINNSRNVVSCLNLTSVDRVCIPVPFFHCFGCSMGTLGAVTVGATMVPLVAYNPLEVLETVQAERCTALYGVPTMFIGELNHPDFNKFDLTSLRTGIMAGSPCPIEVMKAVVDKMGMAEVTIAYGQTESSPVITQTRSDSTIEQRVSTVGYALPNVEVRIVLPGTSEEVPRGVQGELCTRGYHVMKGYYKNPGATAATIDEEGWLHTGDLATMDEVGYVKVTGRLKDMIIRGGENIYPREVEEFLYTHPAVLDVQVVGVPDERLGEEAAAFVILKEGSTLTPEELRAFCDGQISRFKIPRYIEFVDAYPMTASGKIQKFKLREQAIEKLEQKQA